VKLIQKFSPAWWSYLWLNEGFAAYYSYKILNDIFKNSGWLDYFQYYTVQDVMKIDVSSNMKLRPMTHYVEHPGKIRDLFDDFAYAKCKIFIQNFAQETYSQQFLYSW
jgi:aminopeptidase N